MNNKSLKNKSTTAPKKALKKTATVKKTVARKPAPRKPRASTGKTAPKKAQAPITTVIAKIDVGFGNQLFIRGNGAHLTWDRGIAMDNITNDEWKLSSSEIRDDFECKFLINDRIWSAGENLTLKAGKQLVVEPKFS